MSIVRPSKPLWQTWTEKELAKNLRSVQTEEQRLASNDICEWASRSYFIPETGKPIELLPHQKAILRAALTPLNNKPFPWKTVIFSTIKKSGKTAISGLVCRWLAEVHSQGQLFCIGNDAEQAKERVFKAIRTSLELTPGYLRGNPGELPGVWRVQDRKMTNSYNGSEIKAVAVDYRGEAGANPMMTVWTELWGFEYKDALRFWDEMTPVPTSPVSFRWVETYAGFDGESELLNGLQDLGYQGRQLTAGELREMSGEDLWAFKEAPNPDSLVPIWLNEEASLFMYWDSGILARRMPWQVGEDGEQYYKEQEASLLPGAYLRLHHNERVGTESEFVPLELWDACYDPNLSSLEGDTRTPIVLGVDAATTGDCFACVAVSRHPLRKDEPAVRAVKVWRPPKDGPIDFSEVEAWLRAVVERHNIVQIAYDPYQLEDMMQRFYREQIVWTEKFIQQKDRAIADRRLHDLIIQRKIWHTGDLDLREHIANCKARLQKEEDSKMRITKKSSARKIDAAVALSMAADRCLYLNLGALERV